MNIWLFWRRLKCHYLLTSRQRITDYISSHKPLTYRANRLVFVRIWNLICTVPNFCCWNFTHIFKAELLLWFVFDVALLSNIRHCYCITLNNACPSSSTDSWNKFTDLVHRQLQWSATAPPWLSSWLPRSLSGLPPGSWRLV